MSNTNMTVFKFEESTPIRSLVKDGEPWFVAKDICGVLGISNNRDALAALDEDEKSNVGKSDISNIEVPNRGLSIINESGLYALVIRSNKPNARKFRKWITSEVLPSIRKTGKYAAPVQPELPLQASQTDMEKLFRMRHNGVPVIPTPDLAKAFGVSVNQLHGIRERNNKIFTETLDLFTVKGVTDNLICRILKAGYDIVPDCVSINLWTQTGARKLQMLLDGSRIKHKQLFCTEIIPAEKKEMPIAERKRPGKTRVKMLFPDIPIGLETRTELGELARAFAERDPEHGLAPYAEYIAYRTMFRKIRLIRQSVEKIDQCGADVSVLSDRSISGAMIL